jgi:hypothetical protein
LQQQQLKALNNLDRDVFREVGAGGFRKGGQCAQANVRLLRNIAVNDRIGQALHRLEKHLRT